MPPTYKQGFGFNPLAVWCDTSNEPLAAMLGPGNAARGNFSDDHLELLEQVVRAVPPEYQLGHEEGRSRAGRPSRLGPGRLGRGLAPLRAVLADPLSSTRLASLSAVLCVTCCSPKKRTGCAPPRSAGG